MTGRLREPPLRRLLIALAAAALASAFAPQRAQTATPKPELHRVSAAAALPEETRPGDPVALVLGAVGAWTPTRATLVAEGEKTLTTAPFFPYPIEVEPREASPPGESSGASSTTQAPGTEATKDRAEVKVYAAILAVPSTAAAGAALLRATDASGEIVFDVPLRIAPRNFLQEEVALNQDNTALRAAPDPRKVAEAQTLWRTLNRFDPTAVFEGGKFVLPVDSKRRTSQYGDRRLYRYVDGSSDRSIHGAIDFGVPRGTPVVASGSGLVVFAGERIVTGKSVIIEHLPGVFSLYYHMDRVDVSTGQRVTAGQPIGRSGSTGLSTGPHLHWEFRVAGEAADPDAFLKGPILDKDTIVSRILGSLGDSQGP